MTIHAAQFLQNAPAPLRGTGAARRNRTHAPPPSDQKGAVTKAAAKQGSGLQRGKQNALQTPSATTRQAHPRKPSRPPPSAPTCAVTAAPRPGQNQPNPLSNSHPPTAGGNNTRTRKPNPKSRPNPTQTERQAETAAPTNRVRPSQPPPTAVPRAPPAHGPMATGLAANPRSARTGTQAEKQPKPRAH